MEHAALFDSTRGVLDISKQCQIDKSFVLRWWYIALLSCRADRAAVVAQAASSAPVSTTGIHMTISAALSTNSSQQLAEAAAVGAAAQALDALTAHD